LELFGLVLGLLYQDIGRFFKPPSGNTAELLEGAFLQPYPIQRIQLAEVGWESDNKGFKRKRGWVVCIKSCATFSVLV